MTQRDSALDPDAIQRARELLAPPAKVTRMGPVVWAAGFAAFSALAFATSMILAPPVITEHVAAAKSAE